MARSDCIPQSIISQLIKNACDDPQLPRSNPTEAFWQLPASPIHHTQSQQLQSETTYAIIGSGITGCGVAKNLLENLPANSKASVTIFEARSLTSGATGRNGGHLLSAVPEEFSILEQAFGRDETVRIGRFENRTLQSMHKLAEEAGPEVSKAAEVRKVRSVTGYRDRELFDSTKASHRRYEKCLPEAKGDHEVFSAEEGLEKFNMKDTVGVITNSAGALWPYRLVTGLYATMLEQYKDRFFIETETPVTAVSHSDSTKDDYSYTVTTPRGEVRASTIIYCTNGWSGHLLPNLRGKIFPLRGTMSVQAAGPSLPHEGSTRSWSTLTKPCYNEKDQTFSYGLYYLTQNPATGDVFVGGEKQKIAELLTSDDSTISQTAEATLETILPEIYAKGWPDNAKPHVRSLWSGIMGFTPDHVPWVGRIPSRVTGRSGEGEFIAAGFNGYGMPLCWGCGEAVAKMVLGRDGEVRQWLPKSFVISERRLDSPMSSVEFGVRIILEQEVGWRMMLGLGVAYVSGFLRRTVSGWFG